MSTTTLFDQSQLNTPKLYFEMPDPFDPKNSNSQRWSQLENNLCKLAIFLRSCEINSEPLDETILEACILCGYIKNGKLTDLSKIIMSSDKDNENGVRINITKNIVMKNKEIQNKLLNDDTLETMRIIIPKKNRKGYICLKLLETIGVVSELTPRISSNTFKIIDRQNIINVKEILKTKSKNKLLDRLEAITTVATTLYNNLKPS